MSADEARTETSKDGFRRPLHYLHIHRFATVNPSLTTIYYGVTFYVRILVDAAFRTCGFSVYSHRVYSTPIPPARFTLDDFFFGKILI